MNYFQYFPPIIVIYTIILLFLWALQNPYLSILLLFYPLMLLLIILQYLPISNTLLLVISVAVALLYYLLILIPSKTETFTVSDTLSSPVGPSVQNKNWTTALENTRYYQEFANGYPTSSDNGQAGPCVLDNRFGYQLGFDRTSRCQTGGSLPSPVPVSQNSGGSSPSTGPKAFPIITNPTQCLSTNGTDFDEECRKQYGRDVGFREITGNGCSDGQSRADCAPYHQGGKPINGSGTNTSCLRMDLPPTASDTLLPNTQTDGDADLWCRLERNTRRARATRITTGVAAGCYQGSTPDSNASRAECQSNSQTTAKGTTMTACTDWDTPINQWLQLCSPGRLINRIVGDCPPTQGRGVCQN